MGKNDKVLSNLKAGNLPDVNAKRQLANLKKRNIRGFGRKAEAQTYLRPSLLSIRVDHRF